MNPFHTHTPILVLALVCASPAQGQRPELYANAVVQDSARKAIAREVKEGLWADPIARGELAGDVVLELTIDDKGRVETVFIPSSTLPVNWKNVVKDRWMDHRFDFKLPKGHKETVTVPLHFP
jgi:hypothetical protein